MSASGAIKQLIATQVLTASAVDLYYSPSSSNGVTVVTSLIICNTDSSARTFTIHVVPASGSAATGNKIFDNCSIAADTTYVLAYEHGAFVMPANSFLSALADSANVVTITMAGVEYTA